VFREFSICGGGRRNRGKMGDAKKGFLGGGKDQLKRIVERSSWGCNVEEWLWGLEGALCGLRDSSSLSSGKC